MEEQITLIKLVSGEFIIGTVTQNDESSTVIKLDKPRLIQFMASPMGQVDLRFMPVCMFTTGDNDIELQRSHIVLQYQETDIQPDLIKGYKTHISGLKIANTSDLDNLKNGELIF